MNTADLMMFPMVLAALTSKAYPMQQVKMSRNWSRPGTQVHCRVCGAHQVTLRKDSNGWICQNCLLGIRRNDDEE